MRSTISALFVAVAIAVAVFDIFAGSAPLPTFAIDAMRELPADLGALAVPADDPANPATPVKIELGRRLFQDTRLSGNASVSCATCHRPDKAYTDGLRFSRSAAGGHLPRHTPTILNVAYYEAMNWDGKFQDLRQHAVATIGNPKVMNLKDEALLVARLQSVPAYRTMFLAAFGSGPTKDRVGEAIAAYERSLTTPDSPFDRYARGDKNALTPAQKRGLMLFVGKANCAECHYGTAFTDNAFHSLGLSGNDPGRFKITGQDVDLEAFRTPTLRNVSLTAPYMHDGSLRTLAAVVDFYDAGGGHKETKTSVLTELKLTRGEKRDLVAFMEGLTGGRGE